MERVEGVPVYDAPESGYDKALHDGVVHVRGTGFPWQKAANVYIAGHRVGYPGTKSNLVFWDLNRLEKGDEILLTDSDGTRYTYKVFEKRVISPNAVSILRAHKGEEHRQPADLHAPRLLAPPHSAGRTGGQGVSSQQDLVLD